MHQVVETFGRLDILVNNAGRSQRARWEHTDIKVFLFCRFGKKKAFLIKKEKLWWYFYKYVGGRGPLCIERILCCQSDQSGFASYASEVGSHPIILSSNIEKSSCTEGRDSGCLIFLLYRGSGCIVWPLFRGSDASMPHFPFSQGFWLHCPYVELCRESRGSLLWNLHWFQTW